MSLKRYLTRSGIISAADLALLLAESKKASSTALPQCLDASWFLPNNPRNARQEFQHKRLLPGTRFADIDDIKDDASSYPHMLPSTEVFNSKMSQLGVSQGGDVLVYDTAGNFSAPRLAWMLEIFGHPSTGLLDNFVEWQALGNPIDVSERSSSDFEAIDKPFVSSGLDKNRVISFEELENIVRNPAKAKNEYVIFDARPAGRFTGRDPEPRPGLPSGHVPTSVSLPFNTVLNPANNTFLDAEALKRVFKAALKGQSIGDKQVIAMCGTGVTACVIERAIRIAELTPKPVKVYDGSWTEWAQRADSSLIIKDA